MNLQEALKVISGGRVKAGEKVESACRSDRMNAIMDAIESLAAGENITSGVNVRKRGGRGSVILSIGPSGRGRGGGAAGQLPFQVYKSADNSYPPYPILKVRPGWIGLRMPTLAGAPLDKRDDEAGSHPWFYSPAEDYSMFLKVYIDTTSDQINKRAGIVSAKVVTDQTGQTDIDADLLDPLTSEYQEMFMRWDGAGTSDTSSTKGYFLIRIADIHAITIPEGQPDAGNIQVKEINQYLTQEYFTFAISTLEVVALA